MQLSNKYNKMYNFIKTKQLVPYISGTNETLLIVLVSNCILAENN